MYRLSVEERLKKLGLELPEPPPPAASYKPFMRVGRLLYISGQLPWDGGKLGYSGHVGSDLTEEEGYEAAKLCALNVLAQIKLALRGFSGLKCLARIDGHVNCAPGFTSISGVVDGASNLFSAALEDRSGHTRVAVGHNELPLNAAVEVAVTAFLGGEAQDKPKFRAEKAVASQGVRSLQ